MNALEIFGYFIYGIYILALSMVLVYCLMQVHLLFKYASHKRKKEPSDSTIPEWPHVTIQLPIFNEKYVVERLLDNITSLDYPIDKLQIQILDDSTDETLSLTQAKAEAYRKMGFDIKVLHRTDRTGYKAGALKSAMPYAKGSFIAIFDADFLPDHAFLKKTIPEFVDLELGVVQTRWEHINEDYSLLTRLQAFQLNVHFTIEQYGRYVSNYLLQFNGTAGVWRRKTIESAGGWLADTLTEDLDLSYRAQLKGWKIKYLEQVGSPAELPAEIYGLKSQQHRWMKGGAENAKKLIPEIWKSKISLTQKVHGTLHLLSSTVFIGALIIALFSVPLITIMNELDINAGYLQVFMLSLLSLVLVYYFANVEFNWRKETKLKSILKFIVILPVFLAISMGLTLHNGIAVIEGYMGKKSAFVRTPKFNIRSLGDSLKSRSYVTGKIQWVTILEGLLVLYFVGGVWMGVSSHNYSFVLLHVLLIFGYAAVFYYSIKQLRFR